jgi:hypothetical protein
MKVRLRNVSWLLVGPLLVLGCGCVERLLRVETEPSGADVYINGEYAGTSPLEQEFTYYGEYRLDVHYVPAIDWEDRYLDWSGTVALAAPWYQWTPLDLVAEVLVPWTTVDRRLQRIVLEARPAPSVELRGAEDLRQEAERVRGEAR